MPDDPSVPKLPLPEKPPTGWPPSWPWPPVMPPVAGMPLPERPPTGWPPSWPWPPAPPNAQGAPGALMSPGWYHLMFGACIAAHMAAGLSWGEAFVRCSKHYIPGSGGTLVRPPEGPPYPWPSEPPTGWIGPWPPVVIHGGGAATTPAGGSTTAPVPTTARRCKVTITLLRITHSGTDIGNDWKFNVAVQGVALTLAKERLDSGGTRTVNQVAYEGLLGNCGGIAQIDFACTATEVDPVTNDSGAKTLQRTYTCPTQQLENIVVNVKEDSSGEVTAGEGVATLTFVFNVSLACE